MRALCVAVVIAFIIARRCRKRRNRTVWVWDWIKNSSAHGAYHHLLKELQIGDEDSFRHFLTINVSSFETILAFVGPKITYRDTHLRKAIPA